MVRRILKLRRYQKIKNVQKIATKLGITPSQLSILWCLKNKKCKYSHSWSIKSKAIKENLNSINYRFSGR